MIRTLSGFLVLIGVIFFSVTPTFALVNGSLVKSDQFPTHSTVIIGNVLKRLQGKMQVDTCTGTLIARDLVLTASHCVTVKVGNTYKLQDTQKVFVHFGETNGSLDPQKTVHVKQLIEHPKTSDGLDIDLALIQLEKEAIDGFEPAQILPETGWLKNKDPILLVGYGYSSFPPKRSELHGEKRLRSFQSRIATVGFKETPHLVSFIRTNGGMSGGDSGGPVFIEKNGIPYLAIVQSGYIGESPYGFGIPWFKDWIETTARSIGSPLPSDSQTR